MSSSRNNSDKRVAYGGQYPYAYQQHVPRYYPSAFIPRSPNDTVHTPDSSQKPSDTWACDYCQVATFATYEEACEHERTCPMNQKVLKTTRDQNKPKTNNPKFLLCMPGDKKSLSDRQCYVRSNFVEIFEATDSDVSSRHSKGAQRLRVGQIGIRCMYCKDLSTKDRTERAVCYPSSISRIYQTVADMQRFHFETCNEIPEEMKAVYKSLKTTRPRGQGSPQAYWIASAKELGLIDSAEGIRISKKPTKSSTESHPHLPSRESSPLSSFGSVENGSSHSTPVARRRPMHLPPLSPESHSSRTTQSSLPNQEQSDTSMSDLDTRDEDANMLLSLRSAIVLNHLR